MPTLDLDEIYDAYVDVLKVGDTVYSIRDFVKTKRIVPVTVTKKPEGIPILWTKENGCLYRGQWLPTEPLARQFLKEKYLSDLEKMDAKRIKTVEYLKAVTVEETFSSLTFSAPLRERVQQRRLEYLRQFPIWIRRDRFKKFYGVCMMLEDFLVRGETEEEVLQGMRKELEEKISLSYPFHEVKIVLLEVITATPIQVDTGTG
jgi:hypothetical protein